MKSERKTHSASHVSKQLFLTDKLKDFCFLNKPATTRDKYLSDSCSKCQNLLNLEEAYYKNKGRMPSEKLIQLKSKFLTLFLKFLRCSAMFSQFSTQLNINQYKVTQKWGSTTLASTNVN